MVLEVPPRGVLAMAGAYRDDPCLAEIREEAYRLRDEMVVRDRALGEAEVARDVRCGLGNGPPEPGTDLA